MSALLSIPIKSRRPAFAAGFDSVLTCTMLLLPFALAMSWPRLLIVWHTGTFFDTDDAMRMVQVRSWMAGQSWFDLTAHRLDPPAGLPMHWSRVVDVPISILVRLFGLVADPVPAERLGRLAFPLLLQAAMIAATAWVAKALVGPRAVMPAAFLILLSGICYGQFQPGRIDHHAPQILLLMLSTGTTLRALDRGRSRWAAVTGLLIALSLAISLENLPFFAILLTVPALSWALDHDVFGSNRSEDIVIDSNQMEHDVVRKPAPTFRHHAPGGASHRSTLAWFAGGLGTAIPLLFVATVAPSRYAIGACDAFSIAHVTGLLAGAAALGAIALLSPRLDNAKARWAALALAGILVVGLVLATYPSCLHDPYASMDPLIERLWLRHVTEAQPVLTAIAQSPDTLTLLVCPILAGALTALIALWRTSGPARARWLVLTGLIGAGLAGAAWELRVTSSVGPLAVLAGAWAVAEVAGFAQRRVKAYYALLPFGTACLFSTLAWAFVPIPDAWDGSVHDKAGSGTCRQAEAFSSLASFAPTLVFAPIDAGSHLLAHTPLSVVAGPYHRNQHGNRLVLEGFSATPDAAKAIAEGSGAALLTFCRDDTQMKLIAKLYPDSLAAALLGGEVPAWLEPAAPSSGLYPIFHIR